MSGKVNANYSFFVDKFFLGRIFRELGIIYFKSLVLFEHRAEETYLHTVFLFVCFRNSVHIIGINGHKRAPVFAEPVERARENKTFYKAFVYSERNAAVYKVFERTEIAVFVSFFYKVVDYRKPYVFYTDESETDSAVLAGKVRFTFVHVRRKNLERIAL